MKSRSALLPKPFRFAGIFRVILGACLPAMGGCELASIAAYKLSPEPEVSAKYVPAKTPMLVLVENYRNPDAVNLAAEQLTRAITEECRHNNVAPMIDSDALLQLRTNQPERYKKLDISSIGKSLKAEQILYCDLVQFAVEPTLASDMVKGHAQIRVRIIDTRTGHTLWPQDISSGAEIGFDTPFLHLTDGASEATVRSQLIDTLATRVTQLFYKWKSDSVEGPKELQ